MSESTPALPTTFDAEHPQQVWIIMPPRHRWWLHIGLLLVTFLTTTLVGAHMQTNFSNHLPVFDIDEDLGALVTFFGAALAQPSLLSRGLPFSFTLMLILLAHEMGHYLFARHYHVYATLPYFIPFPSLIGTMGAFIRIKSPIPSRDALFDIGIAGPIAGFIPACAAVVWGLLLSQPLPPGSAASSNPLGFLPLIFHLAASVFAIHTPLNQLLLHPVAAAGWVGMFATALNLLPGGQLDGGHIVYSVFPKLHRWISLATMLALIPLAKYFWVGWLVWAVVLWITSYHPSVPGRTGLSGSRRMTALLGVVMLAMALTPQPFKGGSGREVWADIRESSRDTIHAVRDHFRQRLHHK